MSGPSRGPPMASFGSTPGGDSILMTSAPKSANCLTQVGPARTRDRSRMRKRDSAVEAAIFGMRNILAAPVFWSPRRAHEEKQHQNAVGSPGHGRARCMRERSEHDARLDAGQRGDAGEAQRRQRSP